MDETLEQWVRRVGFDLNSGWHCTARNQGWSRSSITSTSLPLGLVPVTIRPCGLELGAVVVVELVAMAMAFLHLQRAVGLVRQAAGQEDARIFAQPHRAALVGDGELLVEHGDHGMAGVAVEFGAVGVVEVEDVAGEFDNGALQAQADAEEGDLAFAGIADGVDLAARCRDSRSRRGPGRRPAPVRTRSAPSRSISSASICG